eukprot:EG_transcript_30291
MPEEVHRHVLFNDPREWDSSGVPAQRTEWKRRASSFIIDADDELLAPAQGWMRNILQKAKAPTLDDDPVLPFSPGTRTRKRLLNIDRRQPSVFQGLRAALEEDDEPRNLRAPSTFGLEPLPTKSPFMPLRHMPLLSANPRERQSSVFQDDSFYRKMRLAPLHADGFADMSVTQSARVPNDSW